MAVKPSSVVPATPDLARIMPGAKASRQPQARLWEPVLRLDPMTIPSTTVAARNVPGAESIAQKSIAHEGESTSALTDDSSAGQSRKSLGEAGIVAAIVRKGFVFRDAGRLDFAHYDGVIASGVCVHYAAFDVCDRALQKRRSAGAPPVAGCVKSVFIL
jgi:hypothetical protein